jgi:threonylcarbamoyladenosine tRNA methylthiotransferase MtaB
MNSKNVLLNAAAISVQNIKEIILNWRQHWDYGKGDLAIKKHQHTFRIQELDKVEGIERLRISSIEPNLLKK